MKVEVSEQVADFVRRLPPGPRLQVRAALRDLAKDKGDIVALEGPLEGYCRLRVGAYRIVLAYTASGDAQCVFAERRGIVYELLLDVLNASGQGGGSFD